MNAIHNIKDQPDRLLLFTAILLLFALVFPFVAGIDFQNNDRHEFIGNPANTYFYYGFRYNSHGDCSLYWL